MNCIGSEWVKQYYFYLSKELAVSIRSRRHRSLIIINKHELTKLNQYVTFLKTYELEVPDDNAFLAPTCIINSLVVEKALIKLNQS